MLFKINAVFILLYIHLFFRIESSDSKLEQITDFVQLDSRHITSVDQSKTNIFDNVDAVDFGKISPDPFLAKGNSNQISGNPFLLQEDQKQVLMTPGK